jgi:hypothetical protein
MLATYPAAAAAAAIHHMGCEWKPTPVGFNQRPVLQVVVYKLSATSHLLVASLLLREQNAG